MCACESANTQRKYGEASNERQLGCRLVHTRECTLAWFMRQASGVAQCKDKSLWMLR
jgi:hypothetical protein